MFLKFIFFINIYLIKSQFDNDQLVLVQILFRHGDRSPVNWFKTNPINESQWPQGFGQLTQIGMKQHFELGSYFRKRYVEKFKLLNLDYNRYEISIRSTNYDRTLMSAYANLAGFYPPNGEQIWNPNINWQPIPVHTIDLLTDNLLYMETNCPAYNKIYTKELNSKEIKKEEIENKDFYDFIRSATEEKDVSIDSIWDIYDPIFCQLQHNKTVPSWTFYKYKNGTIFDKLRQLNSLKFDIQYNRPGEARLKGGVLLKEMLSNMQQKIEDSANFIKKALIYSAHDTTVAAFLCALNTFNHIAPPYASAVMLELWRIDSTDDNIFDNFYVKIYYKNSTQIYPLIIPGCGSICTFNKFIKATENNIPFDWHKECGLINDKLDYCLILIILFVVLTFLFGVIIVHIYRHNKTYVSVSYDDFD